MNKKNTPTGDENSLRIGFGLTFRLYINKKNTPTGDENVFLDLSFSSYSANYK